MYKTLTGTLTRTLIFFLFFTLSFSFVYSQQQGDYNTFELHLSEQYPSPGEKIDIRIRSNRESISSIKSVEWFINGEEKKELSDILKIEYINDSRVVRVIANIIYFDIFGQRKSIQLVRWIRPTIFDIFWEGDSVTTPFYRGYRLVSPQTPINISAKIQYIDQNDIKYTEKDFSFKWEIESEYHNTIGPGKYNITYDVGGSYLNNLIVVRSEASLINNPGIAFEKTISIPIVKPRVIVYENSLLSGIIQTSSLYKNIRGDGEVLSVSVYPFYFSKTDFDKNNIKYLWFVNNEVRPAKTGRKIDILINGERAIIPIKVIIQNENRNLQQASHTINFSL